MVAPVFPRITCGGLFCLWRFFRRFMTRRDRPSADAQRGGREELSLSGLGLRCPLVTDQIGGMLRSALLMSLGTLDLIYRRFDLRDTSLSSCVVVIYVWVEGCAPCHCLKRRKVSPAGDVLFLVTFIGSCSSLSPLVKRGGRTFYQG